MDEPAALRLRQYPASERRVLIKRRSTCSEARNFRLAARQKHEKEGNEPPVSSLQV
jgi:hypothetical protein